MTKAKPPTSSKSLEAKFKAGEASASVRAARWLFAAQARFQRDQARGDGDAKMPTVRDAARMFKTGKSNVGRHLKALKETGVPKISPRPAGRPRNEDRLRWLLEESTADPLPPHSGCPSSSTSTRTPHPHPSSQTPSQQPQHLAPLHPSYLASPSQATSANQPPHTHHHPKRQLEAPSSLTAAPPHSSTIDVMPPADVDTSIAAHATGAAAAFAAAHAAPHPSLQLYGGWFCPFVQRAWIVLAEKRIAHQYVETNPYRKEVALLALNPRGLVPTLAVELNQEGGEKKKKKKVALYESTVICEYLDEAFADEGAHGPRLLPVGDGPGQVFERARCRLWMNHVATRVVPAFYRLLQHTPDKAEPIEEARAGLLDGLRAFAREMLESSDGARAGSAEGPWFLGSRFSMVDVMLAPWAKRLWLIDYYKPGGVGIPGKGERGEDEEVWARWERWFEAVVERESVKMTWSDEGKYIEVYKRYAEDKTQSEVGQATRQGRGLP